MNEKAMFTDFWVKESKTTRNVLARIPEGSQYRPDPKSRTAQEIGWQIVCEEKMLIDALESGKGEWSPAPVPATMKEIVETYENQSASIAQRLDGLVRRALGRHAGLLWKAAPGLADGVEFSVRHRSSPRPDHDLPAADGIHGAADLWP